MRLLFLFLTGLLLALPLTIFSYPQNIAEADSTGHQHSGSAVAKVERMPQPNETMQVSGSITGIFQSTKQDRRQLGTATASFDLFLHRHIADRLVFFADVEAMGGAGPDARFPTMSILNDDAGSLQSNEGLDRLHMREIWMELELLPGWYLTAGKVDLTNYFDANVVANDENTQFYSTAFINSAAIFFPENSPGMILSGDLSQNWQVRAALSSATNNASGIYHRSFAIVEVGYSKSFFKDYQSNLHVYGYQHPDAAGSFGFGLSADQALPGNLMAFARYGINQHKLAAEAKIQSAVSGGVSWQPLAGRLPLETGLAIGLINPQSAQLNNEIALEWYLQYVLFGHLQVSPHIQYLNGTAGSDNDLFSAGLRVHLEL